MIYLCFLLDEKAPKFNDAIKKDCLASNWKFKPCDAPNDFYCLAETSRRRGDANASSATEKCPCISHQYTMQLLDQMTYCTLENQTFLK